MLIHNERIKIVEICKKMLSEGYTNGTAGNVSIFNRSENLIALSPTGIPYDILKPEDVSVVDMNGKLLEGKAPTSEIDMHCIFYKNRADINAGVHAHTLYSTAIACLRKTLPAIDYMIAVVNDKEVRCAEYAPYGTYELAKNAYDTMKNAKAVLLANHGVMAIGSNIEEAYSILAQVEYIAHLYILTKQTSIEPVILDDKEVLSMIERFKNYGQKPPKK